MKSYTSRRTSSFGCQDAFMLFTSLLGLIADSILLVGLLQKAISPHVSSPQSSVVTYLQLGPFSLGWQDVLLTVLVYVGVAFGIISVRRMQTGDGRQLATIPLLAQIYTVLILLWIGVFHSSPSLRDLLRVVSTWLLGLVVLLYAHIGELLSSKDEKRIGKWFRRFIRVTGLAYVLLMPASALVQAGFSHISFAEALPSALVWGLIGLIVFVVLWTVSLLLTLLIAWLLDKYTDVRAEFFHREEEHRSSERLGP